MQTLAIAVADANASLHHGGDESYSLAISPSGSTNLTVATPWGAIRGLETFSHSFPLVVPWEPGLANKGSYGSDMVYSPQKPSHHRILPQSHLTVDFTIQQYSGYDSLVSKLLEAGVRLDKLLAVTIDDIGKETFIMGGALDPFKSETHNLKREIASQQYTMAGAKHVYAVEASVMAEYAQELIAGNPTLGQRIIVIKGKVEDFELPEKADILISEPMGFSKENFSIDLQAPS
ncbi:putative histone-arginine methyltransferase 1.3 [Senna tora]|uniref:type I protein arginine methyltransferase n=1 Tax=Senna tora TaxID=362788 RepID=A0A834WZ64_9FABA|nr:putative histone-arginine methyltransferase 1.3 [Senna tora]